MAFVLWMCSRFNAPNTQQHFTFYKSFQREQALRAWHSKCSTSISQEKAMCPEKTECIWFPSTIKAWCPFISFFPAVKKKNCWILQNPASKHNPLTNTPWHKDGDIYPHTPLSSSSDLRVFIFSLLLCLTPKPPCFPLKTFLFALYISALSPFCPLFFNMSIFSPFI